jgi:hypothetical protein
MSGKDYVIVDIKYYGSAGQLLTVDENGNFKWVVSEDYNNIDNDKYPNVCPRCKSPAYQGLNSCDCSKCGKF